MRKGRYISWNILETLLRFIPVPVRTGWFPIGRPGPDSAVFLTGNYHLTVLRVRWALRKTTAHLLVADSAGINVWCAAAGGHLTNHGVISALKTSGVADKVNHRRVILPQLAAVGIERNVILDKTGWKVIWGPVYAADIPGFLEAEGTEKARFRYVRFSFTQRLEMAAAWVFWMSVILFPICFVFWKDRSYALIALIGVLSFLVFMLFPVWERLGFLRPGRAPGFVLVYALFLAAMIVFLYVFGDTAFRDYLFWGIALFVLLFALLIDLPGSTPVLGSRFHRERPYTVTVDPGRCRADALCLKVCPRACLELDLRTRCMTVPGIDNCIRCGACIVQCRFDAIAFVDLDGKRIDPQVIRNHRLGFSGRRNKAIDRS